MILESALELAARGCKVFPVRANTKLPAIFDFPNKASSDPEQLKKWFGNGKNYNIGISCSGFRGDKYLAPIDIDDKNGKNGSDEILKLELQGFELPKTFSQKTPNNGTHLIYYTDKRLSQRALAPGVDFRGPNGYVLGVGSSLDGKFYSVGDNIEFAKLPEWVEAKQGSQKEKPYSASEVLLDLKEDVISKRIIHYLEKEAPIAIENQNGDDTTFRVACAVKDRGATKDQCLYFMQMHWNDRCMPPWPDNDLQTKVYNAFKHGKNPVGIMAPEIQFNDGIIIEPSKELSPLEKMNRDHAHVLFGSRGSVLYKTEDETLFVDIQTFHYLYPDYKARIETESGRIKSVPYTRLWMDWKNRRSYDGICFEPDPKKASPRLYNVFDGFAVKPLPKGQTPTPEAKKGLDLFLEHAKENICCGNEFHYKWVMTFLAHIFQKPGEKKHCALVLKGGKGIGKNAFIEKILHLVGRYGYLAADRRSIGGAFNSFLERLLVFVQDEGVWGGALHTEGDWKNLITGKTHNIERKGKERYTVSNYTRVIQMGNDAWMVPASEDERRYFVLNPGDKRKRDNAFFQAMADGMEAGGYELLLRYLLDFDINNGIDLNSAPETEGLLEQKLISQDPLHQWWLQCLIEGHIEGFSDNWEVAIPTQVLRSVFHSYCKQREIRSRGHDMVSFGKLLRKACPSVHVGQSGSGSARSYQYRVPDLETARKEWDVFINFESKWD